MISCYEVKRLSMVQLLNLWTVDELKTIILKNVLEMIFNFKHYSFWLFNFLSNKWLAHNLMNGLSFCCSQLNSVADLYFTKNIRKWEMRAMVYFKIQTFDYNFCYFSYTVNISLKWWCWTVQGRRGVVVVRQCVVDLSA